MSAIRDNFNACVPKRTYTYISELLDGHRYPIKRFGRINTPYGMTVLAFLGEAEEDLLRVYLPRRYTDVISEEMIAGYNVGVGDRLSLLKHAAKPGCKYTPLELV